MAGVTDEPGCGDWSRLAGLSAACYLTGRRYDVTAVEREQLPGGRAGVLHRYGFTFDAGPTVLTMADLIADAVRAATGDIVPRSTNCSPRSGWTRHTEPASPTAAPSRPLRPRGDAGGDCPGRGSLDTAAFDSFVDWLRKLYRVEMPNFINRNYDSPLGLLCSPFALAQLYGWVLSAGWELPYGSGSPTSSSATSDTARRVLALGGCVAPWCTRCTGGSGSASQHPLW
jgi:phytoene dehydrogenase-like protein